MTVATERKLEMTLQPTNMAAEVFPGVAARVWKGTTGSGTRVGVLVVAIGAATKDDALDVHLASPHKGLVDLEFVSVEEAFQRIFSN